MNLQYVFSCNKQVSLVLGGMNSYFHGFAKLTNPIQYYTTDYLNNVIHVFDSNWNFIFSKSFQRPIYIIPVGTSLYITSDSII